MEILRSCGINILVVFSDIPEFCFDYELPTTKNFELATRISSILKPWPNKVASRRKLKNSVWPGLAWTCDGLIALTLDEIKFAHKSTQVFHRLVTQPKSTLHRGQTTGHARDLSTSGGPSGDTSGPFGHFPVSSHKISTVNLCHSSHLGVKSNHSASTNVLLQSFSAQATRLIHLEI